MNSGQSQKTFTIMSILGTVVRKLKILRKIGKQINFYKHQVQVNLDLLWKTKLLSYQVTNLSSQYFTFAKVHYDMKITGDLDYIFAINE